MTLLVPHAPLAARMRPTSLKEYVGQAHLLGPGKSLSVAVQNQKLPSLLLWGPPGVGKTTLAKLLGAACAYDVIELSAVSAGVKELREWIDAPVNHSLPRKLMFIDEIHRFNKAQQDVLLPALESGLVTLIGATTENPSFSLNNALLSRLRVLTLCSLTVDELISLIHRAKQFIKSVHLSELQCRELAIAADGDARQLYNLLEWVSEAGLDDTGQLDLGSCFRRFDASGEDYHQHISAFQKSIRSSDPDAALYWFWRLIDGGCDPAVVARRLLRTASEDIGNADPRALSLCLDAWQAYERLGTPEGELALAQAVAFCSLAAKSDAVYQASKQIQAEIQQTGSLPVPPPISTRKDGYIHAHDQPNGLALGMLCLPPELVDKQFYQPVERGLEIQLKARLTELRKIKNKK